MTVKQLMEQVSNAYIHDDEGIDDYDLVVLSQKGDQKPYALPVLGAEFSIRSGQLRILVREPHDEE